MKKRNADHKKNNRRFQPKQLYKKVKISDKDLNRIKAMQGFIMMVEGLTGKPISVVIQESGKDEPEGSYYPVKGQL